MKLATIIVTYNAMPWADRAFGSLQNSSIVPKVWVIDNGSTDGTQDFIKKNFPEFQFIQSSENLGFGKANNIGLEAAYKWGADFFYLMNQDAWVFQDTFKILVDSYEKYKNTEDWAIISPMQLDGSEKQLDIFIDKYIAQNFENRMISDLYFSATKDFYDFQFINAAHWLLPKKTLETVGGFNPYFFHYGEDNEFVNRVHFFQKKLVLVPESRAVHDGVQNLKKVDYSIYEDCTIETKILNPAYKNGFEREWKELQKSKWKNFLLGQFEKAKNIALKLKKLKKEKEQLLQLKQTVGQEGSAFLDI